MEEKLKKAYNIPFVVKYQIAPEEDSDILISVKSDEDVQYMFEEYSRQIDSCRFPHFHLYLIPNLKNYRQQIRYNKFNDESRRRHIHGYKSNAVTTKIKLGFNFIKPLPTIDE